VNYEVLTAIASGASSDGGSGSPGWLQEVGINHMKKVAKATLRSHFDRENKRSEGLDQCDDFRAGQTHGHTGDGG
jgi:hypothetical protein